VSRPVTADAIAEAVTRNEIAQCRRRRAEPMFETNIKQ